MSVDEDELPAGLDRTVRATIEAAWDELLRQHTPLLSEIEPRSHQLLRAAGIGS